MALLATDFMHVITGAKNESDLSQDFSLREHLEGMTTLASTMSNFSDEEDQKIAINFAAGKKEFILLFLLTVAIVGVIGNVLVLVVYLQKKYRSSNAALYIINLAIGKM